MAAGVQSRWWPQSKLGKLLVGLAIALLVLIVLLAAFLASPLFESTLRSQILPRASETLEREITVQRARASLLPLVVRLEGLTMEGLGDYPIARAERLVVRPKIWPALRSFGKTIALSVLRVEGGESNLVRLENGEWDLPTIPEVPPEERRTYIVEDASVEGFIARIIDPSQGMEMEAQNLSLTGSLSEDAAALESLRTEVAGGIVQAVARARTGGDAPGFTTDVEVSRLDLGQLPQLAGLMSGILDTTVRLSAEGSERSEMMSSLIGSAETRLEDGKWHDLSFLEELVASIGEFIYLPAGAEPEESEAVDLGSPIEAAVVIEEGWVRITEPPNIRAAFGAVEVNGRMALDKRLDLVLDIGLSSEFLSTISGGLVEPDEPIPVTLEVTGTTDDPSFELTDTEELEAQNPGFFRRLFRSIRNVLPTSQ